ncbi:TetR/AcrR family transcriptional regulator [Arsenicicoccus dermatophilus]|uniref:TetR/AcrR family transcriptional regulator n=1 Tax=Arsenicicoccus dermatophilus TaxID=1076331 RepID=UPI001F4C9A7C|nr:TetR/AcrR family transcriptional regulator [Arsenicicoccus dermatophilus]
MSAATTTAAEEARQGGARADKAQRRRDELADAALETLARLGYARTSLREIAHQSDLSHGVVHYYFADKHELIAYCVGRYKRTCVRRYDELVASAATCAEVRDGMAAECRRTMAEECTMHRLWYDLRAQSMYEPSLREVVHGVEDELLEMMRHVTQRYADLAGVPAPPPLLVYAAFDGLFEHCLVAHYLGDETAAETLEQGLRALFDQVAPAS